MRLKRLSYDSPLILSFAFLSLAVLLLDRLTGGRAVSLLFCVYRSPLSEPLTWPRFVLHVLGHSGWEHYIGNMLMLLVVGLPCEARYGSGRLGLAMLATALVSGLLHWALFPGTALLGASGIVFMLIILSSFAGAGRGELPLTLLLVLVLYLGGELVSMLTVRDNISHLSHILGGLCGAGFGFLFRPRQA